MDALVVNSGDEAQREENWRLRQRLRHTESNQRLLEKQNRALQRRVQQLEAQLADESKRREDRVKREQKWIVEHDANVRALLRIIGHHEAANEELQREVELLQAKETVAAAAVVTVSRSTQTDVGIERSELRAIAAQQDIDTRTTACIKHLYDRLQESRKDQARLDMTINSQGHPIRSAVSTGQTDFRSSVVKRLRQSPERPAIRPLPVLEEVDEDEGVVDNQDNSELQGIKESTKDKDVDASGPSLEMAGHYQGLEEQNRRLQERLESQQSLLDQLLRIKLDQVDQVPNSTRNIDSARNTSPSPGKEAKPPEQSGPCDALASVQMVPREECGKHRAGPTVY